jgi:type IV secretory pathway protease TraF
MGLVVAVLVAVIGTVIVMAIVSAMLRWLWNTTVPEPFGLRPVTFWRALKFLLIATILFGGPTSAAHFTADDGAAAVLGQDEATRSTD